MKMHAFSNVLIEQTSGRNRYIGTDNFLLAVEIESRTHKKKNPMRGRFPTINR